MCRALNTEDDGDLLGEGHLRRVVGGGVAPWNDAPGRTQAEVVAALRKAADLARSEGQ